MLLRSRLLGLCCVLYRLEASVMVLSKVAEYVIRKSPYGNRRKSSLFHRTRRMFDSEAWCLFLLNLQRN